MSVTIPEGFIEEARYYSILSVKAKKPIYIGGKIMMNLVVREQMSIDNIVATTGKAKQSCIIIVDYSNPQIEEMIGIANQKLLRMRGGE